MADVAWGFRFQPSELERMTLKRLLFWHGEAVRLYKETARFRGW